MNMQPTKELLDKHCGQPPIYDIVMIQHIDKVAIGSNGKELDSPDYGTIESLGFYYEYETAVRALHENWADINEAGLFSGAWIEMKFPGLYPYLGKEYRQFFIWDEERGGYFEAEEPEWWNG